MLTHCVFSTDTTDGLYFRVLEGVAVAAGQRSWANRRRNKRCPGSTRTTLINCAILATWADNPVKTGRFILLSDGVINESVGRGVHQMDRPRDILILNTMSDLVGSQRLTAFSAILSRALPLCKILKIRTRPESQGMLLHKLSFWRSPLPTTRSAARPLSHGLCKPLFDRRTVKRKSGP